MAAKKKSPSEQVIPDTLIETVCRRLSQNKRVRRTLPGGGRLHIDRQLPFLCVYRRPESKDMGTERFVKGEASYLVASGSERHRETVARLTAAVARTMIDQFGAFLVIEVWAGLDDSRAANAAAASLPPTFRILAPPSAALAGTVDVLARRLRSVKVLKQHCEVEVIEDSPVFPPGMPPLLDSSEPVTGCRTIGLAIPPVYRDTDSGVVFPLVMSQLGRSLGRTLRQAIYEFAHSQTSHRPPHYHELGRRAVVKAVWEADRQLGEVSSRFDFLLQLTPVNSDEAWQVFKASGFEHVPELHYRPMPFDPALLKRQLYQVPVEKVEDPALQHIFQEKQYELDRKITMLVERDTRRFLYGSLQLYGGVDDELLELATGLLEKLPRQRSERPTEGALDAEGFASRARHEFDFYRARLPEFTARAEVTTRVPGVMVSRGRLLINRNLRVSANRVEGLLQHEVGTHLLTYYNGRAQVFRQLYAGLAGYEALQEGLAVLGEYISGGLDRARMRQLAGRVVSVRQRIDGASFMECIRALHEKYGFPHAVAFRIVLRVYRGGGLTKDAIYLRGLRQMLNYVARGGDLKLLFLGKFSTEHLPVIKELHLRKVLRDPPLLPRYLECNEAVERLARLRREKASVLELVD